MEQHTDLQEIIEYLNPSELDYQDWVNVGMALKHEGYSVEVWDAWSKYFMKGRKVLVLNEYDDKSISAERIEDCLPKEAKYLVDVPAVSNQEFEQAVQDMVEPDQNENDTEGDE